MRYLGLLFFILLFSQLSAQDGFIGINNGLYNASLPTNLSIHKPNLNFLEFTEGSSLVSVRTSNAYFHKSYLINKKGETLSSGFMPSPYFLANSNKVVINGQNTSQKDSFNPYGAYDMTSMILLTTFNSFISRIKINRR